MSLITVKICSKCGYIGPETDFSFDKSKGIRIGQCKKCQKAYNDRYKAERIKRDPNYLKDVRLKHRYGLTIAQWEAKFEAQGRRCAVCKTDEPEWWCTDHHHQSNMVRDILCNPCNKTLGFAKENTARLRNLADYIERHHATASI